MELRRKHVAISVHDNTCSIKVKKKRNIDAHTSLYVNINTYRRTDLDHFLSETYLFAQASPLSFAENP